MQLHCDFDATVLAYKHFAVFLKMIHTKKVTSDEDTVHRSVILVCFPSGLTPIDISCQLESTECYNNVSRALAYSWHGRFSDGSTDNTSCGWPEVYLELCNSENRAGRHQL